MSKRSHAKNEAEARRPAAPRTRGGAGRAARGREIRASEAPETSSSPEVGLFGAQHEVVERPPPVQLASTGELRAGAARVDITPGFLTPLAGWGPLSTRRMDSAWGRLFARVLVLDDGQGERIALVAADLHAGTRYVAEHLARRVAVAPMGIHIGRLFLAGTHTHSGPGNMYGNVFYDANAGGVAGLDRKWIEFVVERLEEGVRAACAALRPARVGFGVAHLWQYSRNRSLPGALNNFPGLGEAAIRRELRALAHPHAGEPPIEELPLDNLAVDPRLQCVWAEELPPHGGAGRPIGAFATFGVHATIMPSRFDLCSPDIFGIATRRAEELLDERHAGPERPVLGLAAGAIGDIDPDLPEYDLEDIKRLRSDRKQACQLASRVGRAIGDALVSACDDARRDLRAELRIVTLFEEPVARNAEVSGGRRLAAAPMIGNPTLGGSELGRGWPFAGEGSTGSLPDDHPQAPKAEPLLLRPFLQAQFESHPHTLPLRLVKLGDVWLAGVPGEPTAWLSLQIARALQEAGAARVMVAGVCGEYGGYFTTTGEYLMQQYEGSSTLWGRYSGDWLVERFAVLAARATSSQPFGAARFTLKPTEHQELVRPKPSGSGSTPVWPLRPGFISPGTDEARSLLGGRWYAWAPQRSRELGWMPWVRLEVERDGHFEPLLYRNRPADDQHLPILIEYREHLNYLEWRWSLAIPEGAGWSGKRIRFIPCGPAGTVVRPPPGEDWPVYVVP